LQGLLQAIPVQNVGLFRAEERSADDDAVGAGVEAGVELAPLFFSIPEISSAEDCAGSLLRAQNREKVVVLHTDELDRIKRGQPVGLLPTDDFQIVVALYDAVAGHSELAVLSVGVQRADTGPHDDAIGLRRSD